MVITVVVVDSVHILTFSDESLSNNSALQMGPPAPLGNTQGTPATAPVPDAKPVKKKRRTAKAREPTEAHAAQRRKQVRLILCPFL